MKTIRGIDSNGNAVVAHSSDYADRGDKVWIIRMVDNPATGYIAYERDGHLGLGDQECPSGPAGGVFGWFGAGHRYPTVEATLADFCYRP